MHNFIFLLISVILFNACASMGNIEVLDTLYYKNNNLDESYNYAKKHTKDDFLWSFQGGILAFHSGEFAKSTEYFNISESFFEESRDKNVFQSGVETLAGITLKQSLFKYYGNLYEAVFINYYKALNAIMNNDYATSRVEFNRANDRLRRSKEYFSKKISEIDYSIQDNLNEYNKEAKDVNISQTYKQLDSIYSSKYSNLNRFSSFEGYINPLIPYMSGIFFLTQNDFAKSFDLLKEAYGINSQKEILKDLEILENRKNRKNRNFYTWIFIEDGRSPKKFELKFEFPLFLFTSEVFYFGMALPNIDSGEIFNGEYYVSTNKISSDSNSVLSKSFQIGNMESMVANEFNMELPYIIITTLISSSYKVYLQYILGDTLGPWGNLAATMFNMATTSADIRSSRILPLKFEVIRIKNIANNFHIFGDNKILYDFSINKECSELCLNKDNIIYIRVLQNGIISSLTHSIGEIK